MRLEDRRRYKWRDTAPNETIHLWIDQAGPKMPAAPERRVALPRAGGVEEQEEFADSRRRIRLVGRDEVTGQAWGAAVYVPGAPNAGYESIGGAPRPAEFGQPDADRARRRKAGDQALSDLENGRSSAAEEAGLRAIQVANERFWGSRRL
jgi:hypothetical protein